MAAEPSSSAAVASVGVALVGGGVLGGLDITIWGFMGVWASFCGGVITREMLGVAARRQEAVKQGKDPALERGPDYLMMAYSFPAGAMAALISTALIRAVSYFHPFGVGALPDYTIPVLSGAFGWAGLSGFQKLIDFGAGFLQKKTGGSS